MIFFGMIFIGILFMMFWGRPTGTIFPTQNHSSTTSQPLSTTEIAQQRYARGEITADEYREIQQTLNLR